MKQQTVNENIKELTITRTFNANREMVFKMWTDPEHVSKWYGPKGFSITECKIDLRPGGEWLAQMKSPDGKVYPSKGFYKEIVPSEKLVFLFPSHFDENGNSQVEMLNTVTLIEKEGKTKMTLHIVEVKTIPGVVPLKGLDYAWGQSFDKLAAVLEE